MKSIYCALLGLFVITISCNKNDDNNDNPPPANNREWFKLKTLLYSSEGTSKYWDSTEIEIDSVNNKITFRELEGLVPNMDTSMTIFTYNSQNQLVLYQHFDTYDQFYISRMEFVRDAITGQLTMVLSQYKDGKMPKSEGIVRYDKRGDTTFVTFIDSTKKHRYGYTDAQDFYQVGLVNGKVVYNKDYSVAVPGMLDSSQYWYVYDAAGNISTETFQYRNTAPVVYTYQRGAETPKELQKFLSQWAGDLLWFKRSKLFGFGRHLATVNTVSGNVLQAKMMGSAISQSYANTFNASGNLSSVTWQTTTGSTTPTTYTYREKYYYRP
jgi:hypothetical protein